MAFKILSFDGGGLRGVVTARVLANLFEDVGNLSDSVDLLAGSSVGGTNALALASGMNPAAMVELYQDHAASIFRKSIRRGFFRAVYKTDEQRAGHLAAFAAAGITSPSTIRLRDLKKRVVVTAFQLNGAASKMPSEPPSWRGKLFHNYELDVSGKPNPDLDEFVIDVLLRSSAAPIAFPVYQGFADGGLVAINPTVCAIAQAVNADTGGASIGDVCVISIGTGRGATHSLNVGTESWGLYQWAMNAGRFSDRFIDAFADVPAFQAEQLLGERHLRLNPPIPPTAGVDRPSDIPDLVAAADDYRATTEWRDAVNWVIRFWQ